MLKKKFGGKFLKVLSLAMAATMILSSCGNAGSSQGSSDSNEGGEIKDIVLTQVANSEMSTFNWLHSQEMIEMGVLTNCVDGLLSVDTEGKLIPCIAESWDNENSQKWIFKLRDSVKWVDVSGEEKADCNAYDFATGLEWILNYHKNDANNASMPCEMIKGARDYYRYTKTLSKEEAYALTAGEGSKFLEMVGVEIPDERTVVYECMNPVPYFDTLAPYVALYPLSAEMVEELGVDGVRGMDNKSMWYNGAYLMDTYIQGNEKVLVKNPHYWDSESKRFDSLTYKMVESNDVAFQLYSSDEVDYVTLTESALKSINENPEHRFHDYLVNDVKNIRAYHLHFNYNKHNPDGTLDENWNKAIANEAFRKSIYYGVDFGDFYRRTNLISPYICQNNFYTPSGACYKSDGTEYTDIIRDKLGLPEDGDYMIRYSEEKGQEYKKQAVEELEAIGVTFPIEFNYYVKSGNQVAIDGGQVFKTCVERGLGEDYIKVEIKEYVSSYANEVTTPKVQSVSTSGWGLDYGDPMNALSQEIMDSDGAWYARAYSNINEIEENEYTEDLLEKYHKFTDLVNEANEITEDLDERYEKFAEAEAYLIDHALVIPLNLQRRVALSKIDISSRKNAMFGIQNEKAVNWNTNSAGYTTEEAKALENAK